MKKSIKFKLLSLFICTLLIVILLSFILQFVFFEGYYMNHTEKRLETIFYNIEENLEVEDTQGMIFNIDRQEEVSILIVDENINLVFSSNFLPNATNQQLEREFYDLILSQAEVLESTSICQSLVGVDGPDCLVYVQKLSNGNYGVLYHPLESIQSNISAMTEFHIIAIVLVGIIGSSFVFIFSNRFTKPIIEMSKATERLSNLEFHQKITYASEDELGQLAISINCLSENLEKNMSALQKEIAFQKVLTQNMSHELKTPISVMKGYLEALSFGVAKTKEKEEEYFQVVIKECDRMNELITNMLDLSKLTSFQESGLDMIQFSATQFADKVEQQSDSLLQSNGVKLEKEIEDIMIWGNPDLLLQAFMNFITNAMKYGDKQEIKMFIYEDLEEIVLSLFNTGEVIPEEEIGRVFEVFYMVDKVRGRNLNSHGLGLSVTKTIVDLHQGKVDCKAVDEDGMIFFINLPKK